MKREKKPLISKIVSVITILITLISMSSIYSFYISNKRVIDHLEQKQREYIISQIESQKDKKIAEEIEYINLYAKAIKGAVAQSLYQLDDNILEETLSSFAKLCSISGIYIYDDIAKKQYFGVVRKDNNSLEFIYNWSPISISKNKMLYSLEVDDKKIGKMVIVYDTNPIIRMLDKQKEKDLKILKEETLLIRQKMENYLLWQIAIIVISMIILLILIIYILNNIVNRPLKILQQNMHNFFIFFKGVKESFSPQKILTGDEFEEISEEINKNIETVLNIHQELKRTQEEILFIVGSIAEAHSRETGLHVKRVSEYSKLLAKHYGLSSDEVELIGHASAMHDIGKIAIPESILLKPGRLTDEEFEIIKQHSVFGYNILRHSKRNMLKIAAIIAYEHHEKYNGRGYPRGLKGEDIHIYGRIVALADVFDALGNDRVYKKAWSDDKIFALFKEEKGRAFDPKLVDIFFDHIDDFLKVRDRLNERY